MKKKHYLTPTISLVPIALSQCVAVSAGATNEKFEEITFEWE